MNIQHPTWQAASYTSPLPTAAGPSVPEPADWATVSHEAADWAPIPSVTPLLSHSPHHHIFIFFFALSALCGVLDAHKWPIPIDNHVLVDNDNEELIWIIFKVTIKYILNKIINASWLFSPHVSIWYGHISSDLINLGQLSKTYLQLCVVIGLYFQLVSGHSITVGPFGF